MVTPDGVADHREYPSSWSTDVVLSDGQTVQVRPIVPQDADRLRRFHARQSPESIYFRYFSPRPVLSDRDVEHFTNVDHDRRVAFVALSDDEIIAVARYEQYQSSDVAEVAFFVDDMHHGRGLATLLLEYLAAAGRERGIRHFTATTLPNNSKMLSVFTGAGYSVATKFDSGVIEVAFDIQPTDDSLAAMDRRERRAEAASVKHLLNPRSIAVIGAGRARGSIGAEVYLNLLDSGFTGDLHAVNRSGSTIGGRRALTSITDLPDEIDLAVIATPAADVVSDVDRCGQRGVKALVIVSAGFSEAGEVGLALERQVVEVARSHGMRLLGPNCLGILNTDPAVSMNASITGVVPPLGPVAVFAETGTLAAAMIEHAALTDMGVSTFVAAGNRVDVTVTDFLSYWVTDESTNAVLLSLKSQELSPRFIRAARAASLEKPVAALSTTGPSVGVGEAPSVEGRRAAALFRQTGVINVRSLEELFDIGRIMADQPVPAGPRIAVIGNSDGAVMLAANACRGAGLVFVDLDGVKLPEVARVIKSTIDLTYRATAADFSQTMELVAASGAVDMILVVYAPPTLTPNLDVNEAVLDLSQRYSELTVATTMFGSPGRSRIHSSDGHGVPVFTFPEAAAYALGRLASYRNWYGSADSSRPVSVDQGVELAVEEVLGELGAWSEDRSGPLLVNPEAQERLLGTVGVPIAERRVVHDADQAVDAADEIGWPVVLKAASRDRSTRSVASGVTIDVIDEAHLRAAWQRMNDAVGERMVPAIVQRFLTDGTDLAIRLSRDSSGTTTVSVGLGGPARIAGEAAVGIVPLSLGDASSLVAASPVAKVLTDPLDRVSFVGLVHGLAMLAESMNLAFDIDADPVITDGTDVYVVDVDVTLFEPLDEFMVRRIDDVTPL